MTELNHDLIIWRLDELSADIKEVKVTLDKVCGQTTKTNGRVSVLEAKHDNCPGNIKNKKSVGLIDNLKKEKTIIILLIVVILVLLGVNISDIIKLGI